MTYASWSKPNGEVLRLVLRAVMARKFHIRCLFRMTWSNKREWYVFEELGGFRNWLWHVWQWMVDYIEYEPRHCEFCALPHWVGGS